MNWHNGHLSDITHTLQTFWNLILNEYQELTNMSRQTATIDLSEMVKKMCSRGQARPVRELPVNCLN